MTVPLKTRILLADDHAVVRDGLRMVLDSAPDLEVVAEAGDGAEAVELALSEDIDLAVLDVSMPRMTGLQAAHELYAPQARAARADPLDARQRAVLLRGAQGRRLGLCAEDRRRPRPDRGLPGDHAGRAVPLPGGGRALVATTSTAPAGARTTPEDPLTPRELEVVKLIAEGCTSEEIAEQLFISKKTVDRHRANMLEKLGMRDRVELTRYAIRAGSSSPDRQIARLAGRGTTTSGDWAERTSPAETLPSRTARIGPYPCDPSTSKSRSPDASLSTSRASPSRSVSAASMPGSSAATASASCSLSWRRRMSLIDAVASPPVRARVAGKACS